jgi:hypothetical protein
MGHSGVRIHAANPNTWLACLPFGAELTIEDHDLVSLAQLFLLEQSH